MQEFGRVANSGKIGQRVQDLVKRREAAISEQQRNDNCDGEEFQWPRFNRAEKASLLAKRLRGSPDPDQPDQQSRVIAAAGESLEPARPLPLFSAGVISVPRRVAPDRAPVNAAFVRLLESDHVPGRIHAIAEQSGDN